LTERLCPNCQQKLADGSVSKLDVEVSKILYKINEAHNISNASFSKTIDFGKVVVIITDGEAGILIGRGGKVVSALSSALGRRVRIVRFDGDPKRAVADMLAPARLCGINSYWTEGQERVKVRINPADKQKLYVDENTLRMAIKHWMGKDVEIVFE